MKYSVRLYFGLMGCLFFILLSSQAWAMTEIFHLYRTTGAGTWEHLNDLSFISSNGNQGSIVLESDSSGPSVDELPGLLSGFVTECIKDPVAYEDDKHASPHCPMVDDSFFLKLPVARKKVKAGKAYSSREYWVAAGPGNASREIFVNRQTDPERILLGKWNETALLHKLFFEMLLSNKVASSGLMLEDINDELESDIKQNQGVQAAAKFAKKEQERTDDLQDSWLSRLAMARNFFSAGQPYLDLVFGTSCQWRISIIYSAGVFRGLQFENAGMTYLLLMSSSLAARKGVRTRSSAVSIKERERPDSRSSRASLGSRTNSDSSARSGGNSLTELPLLDSYSSDSPKQSPDDDKISGGEWLLLTLQFNMRPDHSIFQGVPFWFYISGYTGPIGGLNPLP